MLLRAIPYQAATPSVIFTYELMLEVVYPALRRFHKLLYYTE